MNQGKYVLSQLFEFFPKYQFDKCVSRYNGDYRVRSFTCWNQFLTMSFGQLTNRESLRDTVLCLKAHESKLYHLGIGGTVPRSTLAEANENRDWRIYADFAEVLIRRARSLYADDEFGVEISNPVYALDSTTVDLCLSVFWWAPFRKTKAAIKLHVLLDLRGNIPTFVHVTDGLRHDVNTLDLIETEPGAFYIMDKAYGDFKRLMEINRKQAFFVVRPRKNFTFDRLSSSPVNKDTGLRCDQRVRPVWFKTRKAYPAVLRRVSYFDKDQDRKLIFLTNNFEISAIDVAMLYKHRWQVELFFKWIKQHLKIKKFWGESENAVKTQVWIAICVYLTVAIAKKELGIERNLYEILQILSVSAFDKTQLNQLLSEYTLENSDGTSAKQLNLWDF